MFLGGFLKMDKNDSVIKTTVAVLDPRTCKHQCVTMRTKDFFFQGISVLEGMCVSRLLKKNLLQNQADFQAQDQCQTI